MSVAGLADGVVTIQRETSGQDAFGAETRSFADHITGQRARVTEDSSREGREYARETGRKRLLAIFPGDVDVVSTDRVVQGDATYEVRGVTRSNFPGEPVEYTRAELELVS